MNIAIFTNNYLPNPFGVTGSIESFRKQFEKMGHTVYVFAPYYKNYEDKNPNACPTENFSGKNFGRVFRYLALDISYKIKFPLAIPYSSKMDKILEDLKIDIIHSQHPNLLGTAAAKWAKRKKIPLIFTWHTLYDQYTHFVPLIPDKIAARFIIRKAVKYANDCDQVIVPTNSIIGIIKNWGVTNRNIAAIPTGVEPDEFENPDRKKIRNNFGIKDDEILLLLVSRITAEKNIEFLFNALSGLIKNDALVKFLVAGDGDLLPKLKDLAKKKEIAEKVIFQGIVPREEIKNYFAAGDIFVYASKSETQGMIISEAMYSGLPVVAVRATGAQDLVEDNTNGFLVPEDDKKFSDAAEKLIKDDDLREKFGRESARIARERFTAKVCAEKMLKIYNELVVTIDNAQ
jgi:1,2-diacylglycerol 3-alpha-glucosyltransferase